MGWSGGRLNCIGGFVRSVIDGFFESVDLFDKCLNACVTLTLFGCFPFGGVDDVVDEFLSGEGEGYGGLELLAVDGVILLEVADKGHFILMP